MLSDSNKGGRLSLRELCLCGDVADDLGDVNENPRVITSLIARSKSLTTIAEHCSVLVSLSVLSLSHNQLTCLDGFQLLRGLKEVNLNNNLLTSLDNIQASSSSLRKLYASGNRIQNVTCLAECSALETLSIMSNDVKSIALALRSLETCKSLRELDLAGNPCAPVTDDAWRYDVARCLPWLCALDGEDPPQPPHENEQGAIDTATLHDDDADVPIEGGTVSSSTGDVYDDATVGLSSQARRHESGTIAAASTRPCTAPPAPPSMTAGSGSKIFRSPFLNNHPILLEYLAETAAGASDTSVALPKPSAQNGQSTKFVGRLRGLAADMGASAAMGETPEEMAARLAALPSGGDASAAVEEHVLGRGMQPMESVRRLLLLVDRLRAERDGALDAARCASAEADRLRLSRTNVVSAKDGVSVTVQGTAAGGFVLPSEAAEVAKAAEQLAKENATLRRENANMFALLDENKNLRRRLEELL